VPGFALVRLMALRATLGCPKDTDKERNDDHGHDDKRGSDVHALRVAKPERIGFFRSDNKGEASSLAFCWYRFMRV